jgi:hypothetical protein
MRHALAKRLRERFDLGEIFLACIPLLVLLFLVLPDIG